MSAGPGAIDAITAVRGIRVGHWTDRRAATGCTVVLCPPGTVGGVDVRGGAPGTRETDLLRPENLVQEVHAVLLAGGSAFGLDAAAGVMRYLEERGIGFPTRGGVVPIVPAAILLDLGLGRPRRPGPDEGYRAAARATAGRVAEGSVGAGTGATVAKFAGPERLLKGGTGTAAEPLDGGLVVGALVAVNAVGAVVDPESGGLVAAPRGDRRRSFIDPVAHFRAVRAPEPEPGANTTLVVVATNAALDKARTHRLATVAHNGLARSIWPAHTLGDGDTVFALATGERPAAGPEQTALEALAVRAVERAVVRAARLATGLHGVPAAAEWTARAGRSSRR